MRLADFRETLSHRVESLARFASLGLSGIKLRFFARLSLYRSGFFIRPRVSSAFIHVIKRVISFRNATNVVEK